VQKNRYATQKEITAEIGKSERTVKNNNQHATRRIYQIKDMKTMKYWRNILVMIAATLSLASCDRNRVLRQKRRKA